MVVVGTIGDYQGFLATLTKALLAAMGDLKALPRRLSARSRIIALVIRARLQVPRRRVV